MTAYRDTLPLWPGFPDVQTSCNFVNNAGVSTYATVEDVGKVLTRERSKESLLYRASSSRHPTSQDKEGRVCR